MSKTQTTNSVIMIEPVGFRSNPETIESNNFQNNENNSEALSNLALNEMTSFKQQLQEKGVNVLSFKGQQECPDDIFPNNWISTHQDGKIIIYPMLAKNRRLERRADIIEKLSHLSAELWNISEKEEGGEILEGTGSLVLDRVNNTAFCALSDRSSKTLAELWCNKMGYKLFSFETADKDQKPIYHTNVMMFIGSTIAGICIESIIDSDVKDIINLYLSTTHTVIPLTLDQIHSFAGNMIELKTDNNKSLLVMSESAHNSLNKQQKSLITTHLDDILVADISTIESAAGGSVRCMLLEVFN
jgi:hypothetical protein